MKKIEDQVVDVIKKQEKKMLIDKNYNRNMKELQKMKKMGIFKKNEFSLSRVDVIGYGRYGQSFQ